MKVPGDQKLDESTIQIHLTASDLEILKKYRGELTTDAFFSTLLRMLDSGAVSSTPDSVKKKKKA